MWIWIALILLMLMSGSVYAKIAESTRTLNDNWSIVKRYAAAHNLPPERIAAIIVTESSGSPGATGAAGERGLMQIMPGALSDVNARYGYNIAFDALYDAETNIKVGSAYLAITTRITGSINLGTQAYNAGAGAVRRDPSKGREYLQRVLVAENTINHLIQTQTFIA